MKLVFIYADIPFWRAEVGRIALFFGGIDFEDLRVSRDEFQDIKEKGSLNDKLNIPFHQLPCLVVNGTSIAQSGGIARFCGKLSNLYPVNDDLSASLVDQFIDFATDITVLISNTNKINDQYERKKNREDLYDNELSRKFSMLERAINHNSNWLVGNAITIADIAIWRLMGWLSSGNLDGIPENFLKNYPRITNICLSVDSNTKIQEWVEKTYPENYNRGNFIL